MANGKQWGSNNQGLIKAGRDRVIVRGQREQQKVELLQLHGLAEWCSFVVR